MNDIATRTFFIAFMVLTMLVSGARAQAPYQGTGEQAGQPTERKPSKAKEFAEVFCPERSVAQKYMMVNATDCNDMCDNAYREHPCDLQKWLGEGWKVTSVSIVTRTVQRDPCECGVTGTESVLERDKH